MDVILTTDHLKELFWRGAKTGGGWPILEPSRVQCWLLGWGYNPPTDRPWAPELYGMAISDEHYQSLLSNKHSH